MIDNTHNVPTETPQTSYQWHSDGLADVAAGLLSLAVGLLYGLQTLIGRDNVTPVLFVALIPGTFLCGLLLFDSVMRGMREQLVYKRFGIGGYGRGIPLTPATAGAFGFLAALLALGALLTTPAAGLLIGIVLGIFGIAVGMRYGVPRYGILGGLAIVIGGGTLFVAAPPPGSVAVLFALLAFVLLTNSALLLFSILLGGEIRLRRRKQTDKDGVIA